MADKEVRVKIVADTSDIKKKLSDLEKSLKDMSKTLDKMDNDGLDKISRDTKELGDTFERVDRTAKELDDTLERIDNNDFHTLNRNAESIQETFKNLSDRTLPEVNRQLEKTQDTGKENNTIFDRLKNLFGNLSGEATNFGNKFTHSFEKGKNSILEMIQTFSGMQTASKVNTGKIEELTTSITKSEKKLESLKQQFDKVTLSVEDMYEEVARLEKEMTFDRTDEDLNRLQKEYDNIVLSIEKFEQRQKRLDNSIGSTNKKIEKQQQELKKLGAETNDSVKGVEKLGQGLKDAFESIDVGDFGGAVDGLKDALSGLFQMIPTKAKIAITAILAIGTALKKVADIGVNQLYKGFDTLGTVFGKISSVARTFGQEIKNAFENLTGFEVDMSSMIETVVNFEDVMVRAGVICGATGEEYEALEKKARELGGTTRYSATQVAEAMIEMGQQGYDINEIMGSIDGVLHLATIGNLDLARSAEIVTNALNAYDMKVEESGHLVDILAQVSVSSGTNVEQLGQALENCASTAGALNIPIEDTAIILGLMGDNFIKSGKAGTSLKTFMANMSKPTKQMTECMAQYNLEGARQKILNGDLVGGYKELAEKMSGLTNEQKAQIATTLAGKEGMAGFLSVVNGGVEGIEELETAIARADGVAQHMAETFDSTLKGALSNLSSAIEERLLQVFDKIKEPLMNLVGDIRRFIDIWNGFDDEIKGGGFAKAIEWLEGESRNWGKAISDGLSDIIKSIDNFVNSASFDNLLQVGTNIINGICDGIQRAKENGSLDSAISTIIRKIVTWFNTNMDTVLEAGKLIIDAISKGISENSDIIGEVIQTIIDTQTTIDGALAYEKGRLFGENLGTFIVKGIEAKLTEWGSTVGGFIDGIFKGNGASGGVPNVTDEETGEEWTYIPDYTGGTGGQWIKTGKKIGNEVGNGINQGLDEKKEDLGNTVDNNFKNTKPKTDLTANEIGQGISDGIGSRLEELDAGELKILQDELKMLQEVTGTVAQGIGQSFVDIRNSARTEMTGMTSIFRNQFINMSNICRNQMVNCANIIKNQCLNMSNSFRTEFVNMANIARNQMVNVSNIIRNQSVNWSNIIRNQITNARNSFTSQMISMASVARTQMVNVSNIIRNQAVSWSNVIRNQAQNARNALTSSFMSMHSVVATQMAKCLSTVRSYMSQIASATSKQMTMNFKVNKTITTTNVTKNVTQGLDPMSTMASMNTNMRNINPSTMASGLIGGDINFSLNGGTSGNLALEIPLILDGREIARASATYNQSELKKLEKRANRRRGE